MARSVCREHSTCHFGKSKFKINEHSPEGTLVGTVSATDPDTDQTLSGWRIDEGNGATLFEIDPDTGVLSVVDSAALDFERRKKFSLQVSVTDGYRRSERRTVEIELRNIPD